MKKYSRIKIALKEALGSTKEYYEAKAAVKEVLAAIPDYLSDNFAKLYGGLPIEERQSKLQEFVKDQGLDEEEVKELMYDLQYKHKMINIQKPQVMFPEQPGQFQEELGEGEIVRWTDLRRVIQKTYPQFDPEAWKYIFEGKEFMPVDEFRDHITELAEQTGALTDEQVTEEVEKIMKEVTSKVKPNPPEYIDQFISSLKLKFSKEEVKDLIKEAEKLKQKIIDKMLSK
jgi:hypothetical protein